MTFCGHAQTTLRFQSVVHEHARTLGEIVRIDNDMHHWSALSLQSHPHAGDIITQQRILSWMHQRLGSVAISWKGKTQIKVQRVIQTSGQLIVKHAQSVLIARLQPRYTRIHVQPLSHLRDSEYALDDFKASVTLHYPSAKRVCVWLVHHTQPRIRIPVWFKVQAYAKVWMSTRHLNQNTPLMTDAFTLQERDIAGLNEDPVQTMPSAVMLSAALPRDHILLERALKAPPLITHGEHVKVTHHHPHITLAIDAIALSDGGLGQTISVKNPLTQQTFAVRIIGLHQAETLL